MAPKLAALFDKLELEKAKLLSRLGVWPESHLRFRPDAESWSALDVVSHLVRIETAFVRTVQRNLPERKTVSAKDRVGSVAVLSVMRSPLRVKVPPAAASAVMPAVQAEGLDELVAQWNKERVALRSLLASLQDDQLEFGVFLHPVGGWMAMPTALKFLTEHMRHHDHQVNRLEEASTKGT